MLVPSKFQEFVLLFKKIKLGVIDCLFPTQKSKKPFWFIFLAAQRNPYWKNGSKPSKKKFFSKNINPKTNSLATFKDLAKKSFLTILEKKELGGAYIHRSFLTKKSHFYRKRLLILHAFEIWNQNI